MKSKWKYIFLCMFLSCCAWAQDTDTLRGMYRTYSAPAVVDTPAPKGYKPVYISHYGRHGSRYHLAASIVKQGRDSLRAAASRGTLTPAGAKVLSQLDAIWNASEGRWTHLAERGALEHQAIAGRMTERFAPVFKGRRNVDAFSSTRQRCISSMEAAVGVLGKACPRLRISTRSDEATAVYIKNEALLPEAQQWYNARIDTMTLSARDWKGSISRLYTDCRGDDMSQMVLARWIWHCWAQAPCLGIEGWDILEWLSPEELRDMARWTDMNLCMKCLRTDIFLENRIATQSALLDDIVTRADKALADGKTAATLRYGHDANLVPLLGLMNVEGFDGVYVLKDRPDKRWNSARMLPMASNLQLVFYRKGRKDPVLVKLLYNEKETRFAGLEPLSGPYYDWEQLKRHWKVFSRNFMDSIPGGHEAILKAPAEGYATSLVQHAIDSISALGGGRVRLSGGTFLIAPIELKSGVDLHICEGSTLLGSPRLEDYPDRAETRHFDTEALPRWRNIALIYADEADDIAISGKGIIDCNGEVYVKAKEGDKWTGWHFERTVPRKQSIPRAVFFAGCRNVSVRDITITNQPAGWSFWVHDCDYVRFRDCNILADVRYPNNDGIHVNCSRDVFISGCRIETGDDSIVIRANSRSLARNKPCERVVATDCTLRSWSSGVRIGWNNDGVMRDCALTRLKIWDSSNGIGCYVPLFKYVENSNDYGRESTLVEDFWCDDIRMDQVYGNPVYVKVGVDSKNHFSGVRDFRLRNVHSRSLVPPYIDNGNDVRFSGCTFDICPETAFPGDRRRHGYVLSAQ